MNNGFAPMDDEEYNETFVSALVDAYQSRGEELHPAEKDVLELLTFPGDHYTPLVYHGHTLVVAIAESPAVTLEGFIDDIHHGDTPVTVPIVLPIDDWRGNGHRSMAASLNWFRNRITVAGFGGGTTTTGYIQLTVNCEAAAVIASAPFQMSLSTIEALAKASHTQLHMMDVFPDEDHDDSEEGDGDAEDIEQAINVFLREMREN